MKKKAYYDSEVDIFFVHKGFSKGENYKVSIDEGDVVIDTSTRGRIRGVEILNAISFFDSLGIDSNVLENLADADFKAATTSKKIVLSLKLKSKLDRKEIPATIAIPLATA